MNTWYFGYKSGLSFATLNSATSTGGVLTHDLPTPIQGPINVLEGCFTLSDSNGNLLMSSEGQTVFDRNNNPMPNGTGLLGSFSSTQSGIVIPKPGDPSKYYIVTVPADLNPDGMRYSLVDMTLNGGLGDVVTTEKNVILLPGAVCEDIAAVGHKNKTDYWLVHRTNSTFYVWLVNSSGFASSPTTYAIPGVSCSGSNSFYSSTFFSPDNKHLVSTTFYCHNVVSADFDTATGAISDIRTTGGVNFCYDGAFSPSGKYIYFGGANNPYSSRIKYEDLRNGNPSQSLGHHLSNFRLGPDNRLYAITLNTRHLTIIHDPDNDSNPDIRIFWNYMLAPSGDGLPTFAGSFFSADATNKKFSCTSFNSKYTVKVDIIGSNVPKILKWDFGDGSPVITESIIVSLSDYTQSHAYSNNGNYTIKVTPYKTDGTALTPITMQANIVNCTLKTNRMTRSELLNSKQQQK